MHERRIGPSGPYKSIAFLSGVVLVGVPYWSIPYRAINLPDALYGPGLLAVTIAAFVLRMKGITSFWRAVGIMTVSVPAAVAGRALVEGVMDPTSHNLWPLEIIIASAVGFVCATGGACVGWLAAQWTLRRYR